MNYLMIRTDDMLNGDGLRVIVFLSGCDHHCDECHNPETWDINNGKPFDEEAKKELFKELDNDYITGLTLSGGDPLKYENLPGVYQLIKEVKEKYPTKTIWLYTGFTLSINDFNQNIDTGLDNKLLRNSIVSACDVIVDGVFKKDLADVNYPWAGSTNQRVIDVKSTLKKNKIVLHETK